MNKNKNDNIRKVQAKEIRCTKENDKYRVAAHKMLQNIRTEFD